MTKKPLSVYLPVNLDAKLSKLATAQKRTKSNMALFIISRALDNHADA